MYKICLGYTVYNLTIIFSQLVILRLFLTYLVYASAMLLGLHFIGVLPFSSYRFNDGRLKYNDYIFVRKQQQVHWQLVRYLMLKIIFYTYSICLRCRSRVHASIMSKLSLKDHTNKLKTITYTCFVLLFTRHLVTLGYSAPQQRPAR